MKLSFQAFVSIALTTSLISLTTYAIPTTTQPSGNPACEVYTSEKMTIGTNEAIFTESTNLLHFEQNTHKIGGKFSNGPEVTDLFYTDDKYKYFANVYSADQKRSSFFTRWYEVHAEDSKDKDYAFTIVFNNGQKNMVVHTQNNKRCDVAHYIDPKTVKSVNVQAIMKKATS